MSLKNIKFKILQLICIACKLLIHKKKIKHYDLVIVRCDALGDYIIWLDALSAYKKKYEGKRVLLICADLVKPLAELDTFFTEILAFNRVKAQSDYSSFFLLLIHLAEISTDELVFPCWQRHRIGDMIISMIQSKIKIGMTARGRQDFMGHFFDKQYSYLVEYSDTVNEIDSIEYFTKTIISINYKYGYSKLSIPEVKDCIIPNKYVVFAISASTEQKTWPVERFVEVLNMMPDDMTIVITGYGDDDLKKATCLSTCCHKNVQPLNLVNKTTVPCLVSIISNASLVLGNDSAAIHIAAATHVPSVCILHGAEYGRFLPYPASYPFPQFSPYPVCSKMDCYGCGYKCNNIKGNIYACLDAISVETVSNVIKNKLSNFFNI